MTENTAPIEDRDANIRSTVSHIISSKQDEMFEQFDRLHRRNIHDDDVVKALRHMGEVELLDAYAEWADIDLREDDNTTMSPTVPDPGEAPSYTALAGQMQAVKAMASPALSTPALDAFVRQHLPADRDLLQDSVDQLRREFERALHTDPVFSAKVKTVQNMLGQLESIHQLDDHRHSGYLIAALLEKQFPVRMYQRDAWNLGMAAAQGIKPAKNPFEEEA